MQRNPTLSRFESPLFSINLLENVGTCRINPIIRISAHAHAHIGEMGFTLHDPTSLHSRQPFRKLLIVANRACGGSL